MNHEQQALSQELTRRRDKRMAMDADDPKRDEKGQFSSSDHAAAAKHHGEMSKKFWQQTGMSHPSSEHSKAAVAHAAAASTDPPDPTRAAQAHQATAIANQATEYAKAKWDPPGGSKFALKAGPAVKHQQQLKASRKK